MKRYWDYVESLALQQELQAEGDYCLAPLEESYVADLRGLTDELLAALPEDEIPTKKRAAPGREKLKATVNTDWKLEYQNGNLHKYSNDDLKDALAFYGKRKTGKKDVLVERLIAAIEDE